MAERARIGNFRPKKNREIRGVSPPPPEQVKSCTTEDRADFRTSLKARADPGFEVGGGEPKMGFWGGFPHASRE